MNIGVRGKLFAASLLLIVGVGLTSGAYLQTALRTWLQTRIERELRLLAQTAKELVQTAPGVDSVEAMDAIADRLGRSSGARVTIIGRDGWVLGDSQLAVEQVVAIENHSARPEVRAAMAEGQGSSRRYSTTLQTDMLYLAVRYRRSTDIGVVRLAVALSEVDAAIGRLKLFILVAGVLGLVLAVVGGAAASHLVSRSLRQLVRHAREAAHGKSSRRLSVSSFDELGGLVGSFNRLVEELEQTVAALAGERDRLQTILESMSEAVLALDEEQRITLANPAAERLLGLSSAPEGRSLLEVARVPILAELVAGGGKDRTVTAEFDLPREPQRRVMAVVAAQRSTGGSVVVMHDVTDMRRLETLRRDFIANVSHELRTPASVIRANIETLLEGAVEDRQHARIFLDAAHRNAERLCSMISELLDLSKVESGELRLELRPTRLNQVVARCMQAVESAARQKNISLRNAVDPSIERTADEKALEQVLVNLLDNAVKYTQAGGSVEARAVERNGRLRIEISDDGPGIEPKHRDRVFERFYRVDPGRSREMGGTGLGLSIVKHLVNAMGGQVGFEPVSPHGSTFWFSLPAAGSPQPDAQSSSLR